MKTLILLLGMFVVGCTHGSGSGGNTHIPAAGTSVGKAQVYVGEASGDVELAKPHADATGKIHLDSAGKSLTGATDELTKANVEIDSALKSNATLQTAKDKQDQQLQAYHNRWLGDKTIRVWYYIVAGWLILGVLGTVLTIIQPVGVIGIIGSQILHFLPFSNIFAIFSGRGNSASTTVNVVTPNPTVTS